MKTSLNPPITRESHQIDASGEVLGRLATKVADLLRGKHKPNFVHHLDVGDFVSVYNLRNIRVTGAKAKQKIYYQHTGYIGNLKATSYEQLRKKNPTEAFRRAVFGMLPANKLRKQFLKRLTLYPGEKEKK